LNVDYLPSFIQGQADAVAFPEVLIEQRLGNIKGQSSNPKCCVSRSIVN
jgi:hypothetical protein